MLACQDLFIAGEVLYAKCTHTFVFSLLGKLVLVFLPKAVLRKVTDDHLSILHSFDADSIYERWILLVKLKRANLHILVVQYETRLNLSSHQQKILSPFIWLYWKCLTARQGTVVRLFSKTLRKCVI